MQRMAKSLLQKGLRRKLFFNDQVRVFSHKLNKDIRNGIFPIHSLHDYFLIGVLYEKKNGNFVFFPNRVFVWLCYRDNT